VLNSRFSTTPVGTGNSAFQSTLIGCRSRPRVRVRAGPLSGQWAWTIHPHVRSLVGRAKQSLCDLRPPCLPVARFDLEFDGRPFDRLRMFYDGFASMKPTPSRGFVATFFVTYGAQYKAALYRWEFLRRNPQYRADYNEFMRRFGAWLKGKGRRWPPSEFDLREYWTKSQQRYFRTKIEPVLTPLCLKWQISDLFSPDFGLEEDRQIDDSDGQGEGAQFPPNRFSSSNEGDVLSTGELKRMGFLSMGNTRLYQNLLLIQVDLNSPMKDLLHHTRKILKYGQENYRTQMAARGLKLPTRRRRFEDYVFHLRIWDLKKEGKRNAEIARLVFPNLSVQSALYNVRDHLKAANKLISGHYREIS
jgi:hypothetical protein